MNLRYLSLILFFLSFQAVTAQEITLKKGVVIDSLVVNDSLAETYAVYLPVDFTMDQTWPVIFIFDNKGRGGRSAQLFREVAEEQGYIVAASNNIVEKDSLLNNAKVATRLVHRVFNLFPVDENGVYTAGIMAGARVASLLPTIFPDIQGVLAVGDIWINNDYLKNQAKFSFVGVAGDKNYKSRNMEETVSLLSKTKLPAEFYRYEGGEEWPFNDVLYNAVGSLTLQAMAKGIRPRNDSLVEKLYRNELETAEQFRRKMQHIHALELLEKMETKYSLFNKGDELKQRQREIRRSRPFRTQRRENNTAEVKEFELLERYLYFFTEDVYSANFENLGWWGQQIKELNEMQVGNNQAESKMAFRVEGFLQDMAKNTYKELNEKNAAIDPIIFTAILQTIFDKENPQGYKNIISLSAQDGDYYTALLYLEDLLKTGYDDIEALYDIPGTLDLKLSPEYNELIKKYLGESKFYDIP